MRSGITITVDNTDALRAAVKSMTREQVLVGVPQDTTGRQASEPEMTNAALAYVHNFGSPARNIPARPFMEPGVKDAKGKVVSTLKSAGKAALAGDLSAVNRALHTVGLVCQNAIKMKITTGPFEPLKPATIAARRRKHQGRQAESAEDVTPLIDTAQMRNAINYVVRDKE